MSFCTNSGHKFVAGCAYARSDLGSFCSWQADEVILECHCKRLIRTLCIELFKSPIEPFIAMNICLAEATLLLAVNC